MIVIIDYNLGNPGSILNMIKKIGYNAVLTSDIKQLENASKIILPGVGSFDTGVRNLKNLNLINLLNKKVIEEKTPILGICLGMQLMTLSSEEGKEKGLGWLNAITKNLIFKIKIKSTSYGVEYNNTQKTFKAI